MGNPTLQRELHYKRYKNKLNHLIRRKGNLEINK